MAASAPDIPQEQRGAAIAAHSGKTINQIASELHEAQLALGDARKLEPKLNATERELARVNSQLEAAQAKAAKLRDENGELTERLGEADKELLHIRAEGDRLARILKKASADADALAEGWLA